MAKFLKKQTKTIQRKHPMLAGIFKISQYFLWLPALYFAPSMKFCFICCKKKSASILCTKKKREANIQSQVQCNHGYSTLPLHICDLFTIKRFDSKSKEFI